MSKRHHTAAGTSAGYVFQIERALAHLAGASRRSFVAVEHINDVAVLSPSEGALTREQDKHSVRKGADVLGDRSLNLWRTLQIWLGPDGVPDGQRCERYIFATNVPVTTPIASKLKRAATAGKDFVEEIISDLRTAGRPTKRTRSKLQDIIDDVLANSDDSLLAVIQRIEVIERVEPDAQAREALSDAFGIDARVEADLVLDALLGWLTGRLVEAWRAGKPGIISKAACLQQCRGIERAQARRRLLPRASGDVPVSSSELDTAMTRPFVEHLVRVDAEQYDIVQAVEHFIRFNTEKHRLVDEGEVPADEWYHRAERLTQRWRNIARRAQRRSGGLNRKAVGVSILEETTYDHFEPLAGEPCHELYMTAGQYHRLADDDAVWWHPDYTPVQAP